MNEGFAPAETGELQWQDAAPACAGRFWYWHPATFELPVLVRLADAGAELKAFFPDCPVPVPLRLLAGGRWAAPGTPHRG